MRIGVPKEIKTNENRVALQPAGAELLVGDGHEVWVERSAGEGSAPSQRTRGRRTVGKAPNPVTLTSKLGVPPATRSSTRCTCCTRSG